MHRNLYNAIKLFIRFFQLFQRLSIAKEFGDKAAERRAFTNLGNAHIFLGDFELAADYYKYVPLIRLSAILGGLFYLIIRIIV